MTIRSTTLERTLVRGSAIALACLTATLIFVPMVTGAGMSAAAISCGGTKNTVEREFDVARPSDIWKVFPAMLRAPELEADTSPAHVVVFSGDFDLSGGVGAPGTKPLVQFAVCVVLTDGTPTLYDGVSRAGSNIP